MKGLGVRNTSMGGEQQCRFDQSQSPRTVLLCLGTILRDPLGPLLGEIALTCSLIAERRPYLLSYRKA